jgi:hypothetical protein
MCCGSLLQRKRCGFELPLLAIPTTVTCHILQTIFFSLPQMTKYCVMRECKNIHSWISPSVDVVFSQQDGMYGFKFPKRFLEISSRDLTLFTTLLLFY